jgi:hypothetical protein
MADLLGETGLRYNDKAILPGAQTERRGGAGPVGACLAVRTPPAASFDERSTLAELPFISAINKGTAFSRLRR